MCNTVSPAHRMLHLNPLPAAPSGSAGPPHPQPHPNINIERYVPCSRTVTPSPCQCAALEPVGGHPQRQRLPHASP